MYVHIYQMYMLEKHSNLFKSWTTIIKINTESKSSIMTLGPDLTYQAYLQLVLSIDYDNVL